MGEGKVGTTSGKMKVYSRGYAVSVAWKPLQNGNGQKAQGR